MDDITAFLNEALPERLPFIKTSKKVEILNLPCAFDIEVSSFYEGTEKRACMYVWQFGINGDVIVGRTWQQFEELIAAVVDRLKLGPTRRLFCYVHNLAYEFQFIRSRFEWDAVFSLSERTPCYARTVDGIEFRCSYILSGYSLEKVGEHLTKYPVRKMVGDLDYSLIRHSGTPLTDAEIGYCTNDVRVVMAYIAEKIEEDGCITRIQLTKTGYVRKLCRDNCLYEGSHKHNVGKYMRYHDLMKAIPMTVDEYEQLKRAFHGGFTHASAWHSGEICENVESYDFTSSYPAVMCSEKFPMSAAEIVHPKNTTEFRHYLRCYCCLFDIEFFGLHATTCIEHPISLSHSYHVRGETVDNGRIVSAEHLITTITDIDFSVIEHFYTWEKIKLANFRIYHRAYLPKDFVLSVLTMYGKKTTLKGVAGMEAEYMNAKENTNACFGMTATDPCRDEIVFDGQQWSTQPCDKQKAIDKYNTQRNRFLCFQWSCWVTSYAMRNLFLGIREFGTDYIYSDTDSVKGFHPERHQGFIERYNKRIVAKLDRMCRYYDIDPELTRPKTIKGEVKQLGVWDDEGMYSRFKTLHAKCYMTEKDGKISITVSGLNKNVTAPYLVEKYGREGVFDAFSDDLVIPPDKTGKATHTYIDAPTDGVVTDYLGNTAEYHEKTSIHMEGAGYCFDLSDAYIKYLMGIREQRGE